MGFQVSAEETVTNPSRGSHRTRVGIDYNRALSDLAQPSIAATRQKRSEIGLSRRSPSTNRPISPGSGSDLAVTRNGYKPGSTQSTAG